MLFFLHKELINCFLLLLAKLILQVHDEIVIDLVPADREAVEKIVREQMEGAAALSVPLEVEIGVGRNWLEAH